jgi:hypothetical protein
MSVLFLFLFSGITLFYGDDLNKYTKLDAVEYSLSTPGNSIRIENETTKKGIEYVPEVGTHAGFAITKDGYSIGVSFLDPLNKEEINLGKKRSKYFDIRFKKAYKKQVWELNYQQYSGYKLKNEDITETELLGIETINYGVHLNYFLADDFDARNGTGYYQNRKKTSWSTLIGIGLSQNFLQSNQTLIPQKFESSLSEYKDLRGIRRNTLSLEYGITGQYVTSKYFVQLLVAIGANIGQTHYTGSDLKDSFKSGPSSILNFNLGHEFKKSTIGFSAASYSLSDKQNNQIISSTTSEILVYQKFFF